MATPKGFGDWVVRGVVGGMTDVKKDVDKLERKLKKKILREAAKAGSKVILREARRLVPTDTGMLKKSLGTKILVTKSGVAVAIIGPRKDFPAKRKAKGRAARRKPIYYAHLVERGTRPHSLVKGSRLKKKIQAKGAQHPGTKPEWFLRNSIKNRGKQAINTMRAHVKQGLAVKKL